MKNSTYVRLLKSEQKDIIRLCRVLKQHCHQSTLYLGCLRRSLSQWLQIMTSPVIPWGKAFSVWLRTEESYSYCSGGKMPNDPSSPTPPNTVPDCQPKADGGVRCSAWLGGTVEIPYELNHVDADIRDYYLTNLPERYIAGIPIKIQISRLLAKLNNRNHSPNDCKNT